ncbi:MAG: CapA family protein [Bacteroidales bacterium]
MKLIITGDFSIADNYQGKKLIDNSIIDIFNDADYRIVNLEAPITQDNPNNKINKTGPHLRSSSNTTLPYLQQLNVNMVTLANNHIMDYGIKGLEDTLAFCSENSFETVGAGKNLEEAQKPNRIEVGDKIISIINFAENEWASATMESGGSHPMDIIDNARLIKSEKENADFVIVIIHGGHEYFHYPSPRIKKQYRFYAEQGASVIVGHHTHCISGYEIFNNTPIIYSLGNFLFTKNSNHEVLNTGMIVILKIEKDDIIIFELVPIQQERVSFNIKLPEYDKKQAIQLELNKFNDTISDEILLQSQWDEFVKKRTTFYLNYLSPTNAVNNRLIRALLNRSGLSKIFVTLRSLKTFLNLIRCESHKDVIIAAIRKKVYD